MPRIVTAKGVRVSCVETGSPGAGVPLLMIHGWAGAAADWAPLQRALPPGMRTIAVDLPGCGYSEKPDAVYDIPWFLDILHELAAALDVPRMVLAGHSMGGQVAVHFASRYPDLVEKLILIDPYGLKGQEGSREPLARLGPVVDLAFLLNRRKFIEWTMRSRVLYKPSADSLRTAVDSTAVSILGRDGARAIARITRRVIGHAHVDALLPCIFQEALVLWGDHDRLLPPRWAERYASRIPRATLHLVAEAGHMPMYEQPAAVAALVSAFLRS